MNIQELARKLEMRLYNVRKLVKYLSSKTFIYINTYAIRIINIILYLIQKIENNTLNKQLLRVYYRITLTNFYYVYCVAYA